MSTELLEHNQVTFEEVENYIEKGQDCCVVNPCGSGKTFVMAAIINHHTDKSFTLVTKQHNAKDYYMRKDSAFSRVNIITYNKLLSDFKSDDIDKYSTDFLLLDEAHYMGAEKWNLPIGCIKKQFQPIMIGFTATPQRFYQQGSNNSIVTDYFHGNSAGNFTSKDLMDKGLFIEPECIVSYYNLDREVEKRLALINDSDMEETTKELYVNKLNSIKAQWEKDSHPSIILNKYVPNYLYKESCNRILVYSSSMSMLSQNKTMVLSILREMLKDKSIQSYDYTYKTDSKALDKFLEEDETYVKVLFSIDKIMETVHIDDLSIVIMLRPSVSNRIITQQYGRINNVKSSNRALIVDLVGNIDSLDSINFNEKLGNEKDSLKQSKPANTSMNLNLHHVSIYQGLFAKIDACLKPYSNYTYDNLIGSATFFANVYGCDKDKLKERLLLGFDIGDAIAYSKLSNSTVNQEIFDNKRDYNISEDAPKLSMDVLTDIVSSFIKRRNIVDEDMQQDLYVLIYSGAYSNTNEVLNQLNRYYTRWCRNQLRHDELFLPYNEEVVPAQEDSESFKDIFNVELKETLNKGMEILTDREKEMLEEYFGLKHDKPLSYLEVANIHSLSRGRTEQIIKKALYKLGNYEMANSINDLVEEVNPYKLSKNHVEQIIKKALPKLCKPIMASSLRDLAEVCNKYKLTTQHTEWIIRGAIHILSNPHRANSLGSLVCICCSTGELSSDCVRQIFKKGFAKVK